MNIFQWFRDFFAKEDNRGVIDEISLTDWVVGGESGVVYKEVCEDWEPFLPSDERQKRNNLETMSCVSFALNNAVETQVNFHLKDHPYLRKMGYLDGEKKVNFSDRFLAIGSGTTSSGNSGSKVAAFAKNFGFIPETDLPYGGRNFYEYHNPKLVTDSMKARGRVFFKETGMDIVYEWVDTSISSLRKHLKQAPLIIFTPLCPSWKALDVPVKTCSLSAPTHAYLLYKLPALLNIMDHYYPPRRILNADYPISAALKVVLKKRTDSPIRPSHTWNTPLRKGNSGLDVKKLQEVLIYEGLLNENLNTGYFGENTENAVKLLQQINHQEILAPQGLRLPTGNVGNSTMSYLNKRYN